MKRLSLSEELSLIKYTQKNAEYINRGSSRAVYDLGDGTVLKLATCVRGQRQNGIEIDTFRWRNDDDRKHLAEIYSYGKFVIVMEKITPVDMDLIQEIYEYGADNLLNDEDEDEDDCDSSRYRRAFSESELLLLTKEDEIERHVNMLTDILGQTDDNYQVGLDKDNNIKSYDYGYEVGYHNASVSNDLWLNFREYGSDGILTFVAGKLVRRTYEEMKKFM